MTYPGLLPRDVIVWLPPGYSENKDERYQVFYMQDGQNIVDPATNTVTHVDWQVDETSR
jgi:predicted alpha/beta superfamily hydrolase